MYLIRFGCFGCGQFCSGAGARGHVGLSELTDTQYDDKHRVIRCIAAFRGVIIGRVRSIVVFLSDYIQQVSNYHSRPQTAPVSMETLHQLEVNPAVFR